MKLDVGILGSSNLVEGAEIETMENGVVAVTLTSPGQLLTPCGTFNLLPGSKIYFGRVEIVDDVIRPVTGGAICLADLPN